MTYDQSVHITDLQASTEGRKDDAGKLRYDLVPPDAIWKELPRNGNYLVSDDGRVFSKITNKVLKTDKIWSGYLRVKLSDGKQYLVHRLVMEAFTRKSNSFVNHKNGIKTDNRFLNLEWCTKSQNTLHSFSIGLQVSKKGEEVYCSKLKDSTIIKIRQLYCLGATQVEIAELFGIKQGDVSNIVLKKSWRHVSDGGRLEV